MSQDLVTSATSQSMIGSRLGGPGAIGSGMSITANQSSHLGAVSSAGGAVADSGGTGSSHFNQQQANGQHKRGIQTSPDGNSFILILAQLTSNFAFDLSSINFCFSTIFRNYFRKGNKHSTIYGNGPVWYDRSLNLH